MSIMTTNWRPSRDDLRKFGDVSLAMLVLLALVFRWRGMTAETGLIMAAVGLVIYVLSRISAKLVKPLYLAMQAVGLPIGWVLSHVVLGIFYYLVLTPVGLVFRLIRRDPLQRRYDSEATTYWLEHRPTDSAKRYFNQF